MWVQVLLLDRKFAEAEQLIKDYIGGSTHLSDPKPQQTLAQKESGNEPQTSSQTPEKTQALPPWMRTETKH